MLASARSLIVSGSNIFASTIYDGVFVSTDEGINWSAANDGLPLDTVVSAFALICTKLFAATFGSGIFLSNDSGAEWARVGLQNLDVQTLLTIGSNIFSGTADNGVFLSKDTGRSWVAVNTGLPNSEVIALGVDTSIYAATAGGVFLSSDSGISWTNEYDIPQFNAFAVIKTFFLTDVILGADEEVIRTTDDGKSWIYYANIGNVNVLSLAVSGTNLIAGTDS